MFIKTSDYSLRESQVTNDLQLADADEPPLGELTEIANCAAETPHREAAKD